MCCIRASIFYTALSNLEWQDNGTDDNDETQDLCRIECATTGQRERPFFELWEKSLMPMENLQREKKKTLESLESFVDTLFQGSETSSVGATIGKPQLYREPIGKLQLSLHCLQMSCHHHKSLQKSVSANEMHKHFEHFECLDLNCDWQFWYRIAKSFSTCDNNPVQSMSYFCTLKSHPEGLIFAHSPCV